MTSSFENKDDFNILNNLFNERKLKKPNMIILINGTSPENQLYAPLIHEIKQGLTAIASNTQAWILGECNFDDQIYRLIESDLYEGSDSENIPFIVFLKKKSNKIADLRSTNNMFFVQQSNTDVLNELATCLRKNLPYFYYKSVKQDDYDNIKFKIPILLIFMNGDLKAFEVLIKALDKNKPILIIKIRFCINIYYSAGTSSFLGKFYVKSRDIT
jgi:hypothetical protein